MFPFDHRKLKDHLAGYIDLIQNLSFVTFGIIREEREFVLINFQLISLTYIKDWIGPKIDRLVIDTPEFQHLSNLYWISYAVHFKFNIDEFLAVWYFVKSYEKCT